MTRQMSKTDVTSLAGEYRVKHGQVSLGVMTYPIGSIVALEHDDAKRMLADGTVQAVDLPWRNRELELSNGHPAQVQWDGATHRHRHHHLCNCGRCPRP